MLLSGAIMNYILALLVIVVMFSAYGHSALMTYSVIDDDTGVYTQENSFIDRDVILEVEDKSVYIITDLMKVLNGKQQGQTVNFTVKRSGQIINLPVLLRTDATFSNVEDSIPLLNALGLEYAVNQDGQIIDTGFRTTGVKRDFFTTIGKSFEYSVKLAGTIFTVLGQLFTGNLGLSSMGGTVTTISVTANAIKIGGIWSLLNIAGFIGVNLAVFNLLPFPALDGSRALFTLIEWIRKKPLNRKVEAVIHAVGFVVLILFAIFADLQQVF